jgi:hypothetical protein
MIAPNKTAKMHCCPVQRFQLQNHIDIIDQPRPEERAPKSGLPDFGT